MKRLDWLLFDNLRRRKAEALASWVGAGLVLAGLLFWCCT